MPLISTYSNSIHPWLGTRKKASGSSLVEFLGGVQFGGNRDTFPIQIKANTDYVYVLILSNSDSVLGVAHGSTLNSPGFPQDAAFATFPEVSDYGPYQVGLAVYKRWYENGTDPLLSFTWAHKFDYGASHPCYINAGMLIEGDGNIIVAAFGQDGGDTERWLPIKRYSPAGVLLAENPATFVDRMWFSTGSYSTTDMGFTIVPVSTGYACFTTNCRGPGYNYTVRSCVFPNDLSTMTRQIGYREDTGGIPSIGNLQRFYPVDSDEIEAFGSWRQYTGTNWGRYLHNLVTGANSGSVRKTTAFAIDYRSYYKKAGVFAMESPSSDYCLTCLSDPADSYLPLWLCRIKRAPDGVEDLAGGIKIVQDAVEGDSRLWGLMPYADNSYIMTVTSRTLGFAPKTASMAAGVFNVTWDGVNFTITNKKWYSSAADDGVLIVQTPLDNIGKSSIETFNANPKSFYAGATRGNIYGAPTGNYDVFLDCFDISV